MQSYVLILFGANAVSYNVASALRGTAYQPVCLLPGNSSRLLQRSNFYGVVRKSKYSSQDEGYLDDLLDLLEDLRSPTPILVFLTNDQSAYFWIRNRSRLEGLCALPTPDIEPFYDKRSFFEAVGKVGVDFPATWPFEQCKDRPFPYLVKPSIKDERNQFVKTVGAKILVANGEEDLQRIESCDSDDLICQEVLDFDLGDEYSWWGWRDQKGRIVSTTARHVDKYPDKQGRITHVELVEEPELKAIGDRIVSELDYRGIADIQFIRDRHSGRFNVIEMNPRMWCSHELLTMAGINLVRLCADDYYGHLQDGMEWPPEYLSGLDNPPRGQWYSVLYNIRNFRIGEWKCDEHYGLDTDNFVTRCAVRAYYFFKFIYYLTTRRV